MKKLIRTKKRGETSGQEGWVAFLDVYGFSVEISKREQAGELAEAYESLALAMEGLVGNLSSGTSTHRLSDNIFLIHPAALANRLLGFQSILKDVRTAMGVFLGNGLAVRGGIAFGTIANGDNYLLGTAVVRAVQYEKMVFAPLVIAPERELNRAGIEAFADNIRDLDVVDAGGDHGLLSAMIITPQDESSYRRYALEKYKFYRAQGPARVALAWKEALDRIDLIREERSKRRGRGHVARGA